jgi:hypothetical protein
MWWRWVHLYPAVAADDTQAYLDTVGDPRSYAARLSSLFPSIKVLLRI